MSDSRCSRWNGGQYLLIFCTMEKKDIEILIEWHDDASLHEMHETIITSEKLTEQNIEFLEMLEEEIEKRKQKVNNIL